jgi:hypothetical protein
MRRLLSYSWISKAVGALLLAAAALKLQGLGTDAVGRMGLFSMPEFQLAVVEVECFLGIWLISGIRPIASWLVSLATFTCFAAVSLYLAMVGQASCGCFGGLSVNPWHAFALDVGIIALLGFGRPELAGLSKVWHSKGSGSLDALFGAVGGILLFSGLLLGLAQAIFGSIPATLANLRGERVSIHPLVVDVGQGTSGQIRHISVELINWTDRPIRIIGGTKDCTCTVLKDLPITIPAKATRALSVGVRMTKTPGIFTRRVTFLVDDNGFMRVGFTLTGQVISHPSEG